jgi:hypothetical protein
MRLRKLLPLALFAGLAVAFAKQPSWEELVAQAGRLRAAGALHQAEALYQKALAEAGGLGG